MRLREAPIGSMNDLVSRIVDAIAPELDRPYAFFGHSMGAVLAWAVARSLWDAGAPLPGHLFVSGRRGPRLANLEPKLGGLSDEAFLAAMTDRYGGIPAELMRHRDVMELLLPAMRADISALENFEPPPPKPMPVDITAMGGADDRMVPKDDLAAWELETAGQFRVRVFPGGHFYLDDRRREVLAEIARAAGPRSHHQLSEAKA